ncbi:pupal cuticle protein Edg-84A-like [Planococcus citri]|uniref:pupal cuticle protein Edg-84A-like n=1 Tax=Planococcus citri TaxID=170843 RepID=UPI0031F8316E
MIRNQVSPIQLISLLVAIPMVFSVLANAYVQHQDNYYDQENHHPGSHENAIEDHHTPAAYSYQYQVHSPHTGDYKTQHEERIGDTVRGSYSLMEPDGWIRIVEYTADPLHGFNAVVKREPPNAANLPSQQPLPQVIEPKPITKPPAIPRPTPIKAPKPVHLKYPPKLFHKAPQPIYYQTTPTPKSRYAPNKYSFFRFHGWPFNMF